MKQYFIVRGTKNGRDEKMYLYEYNRDRALGDPNQERWGFDQSLALNFNAEEAIDVLNENLLFDTLYELPGIKPV